MSKPVSIEPSINVSGGTLTAERSMPSLNIDRFSKKRRSNFPRYGNKRRNDGPPTSKPINDRDDAYQKVAIPKSIYISPRQQYYSIFTSSKGVPKIADYVWKALQSRVKSVREVITQEHFRYVVAMAWYARLVYVNQKTGVTTLLQGSSDLRKATDGIKLPLVITRFIESLGVYQLPNGASVLPFVTEFENLCELGTEFFYEPREALENSHRVVPMNHWSIDNQWIAQYVTVAVPKLSRTGVVLESISQEITGREELAIGFSSNTANPGDGLIRPMAPARYTEAVAEMAAAYGFRDYDEQEHWPYGSNQLLFPLFEGELIAPETIIASQIQSSLMLPQ